MEIHGCFLPANCPGFPDLRVANQYVSIREDVRRRTLEFGEEAQAVPITVRQLEVSPNVGGGRRRKRDPRRTELLNNRCSRAWDLERIVPFTRCGEECISACARTLAAWSLGVETGNPESVVEEGDWVIMLEGLEKCEVA